MEQNICIRVPQETPFVRNFHAAQNEFPVRHKPVHIITCSDSHHTPQILRHRDLHISAAAFHQLRQNADPLCQPGVVCAEEPVLGGFSLGAADHVKCESLGCLYFKQSASV